MIGRQTDKEMQQTPSIEGPHITTKRMKYNSCDLHIWAIDWSDWWAAMQEMQTWGMMHMWAIVEETQFSQKLTRYVNMATRQRRQTQVKRQTPSHSQGDGTVRQKQSKLHTVCKHKLCKIQLYCN